MSFSILWPKLARGTSQWQGNTTEIRFKHWNWVKLPLSAPYLTRISDHEDQRAMDITVSYDITSEEKATALCKQLWRILYNGELVCQIANNNCARRRIRWNKKWLLKFLEYNVVPCRTIVSNTSGYIAAPYKNNYVKTFTNQYYSLWLLFSVVPPVWLRSLIPLRIELQEFILKHSASDVI